MSEYAYKQCINCVMDTSAPRIIFDKKGVCEYCNNYKNNILTFWSPEGFGHEKFEPILDKIRNRQENNAHDCLIGDHVILVNNVGLGGHVKVQDHAILGAMSGVHQF